jgi:uncharacterized protein YqhQ
MKNKDKSEIQIGGQAVIEGVMMRSPRWVTVAVRKSSGEIVIKKEPYLPLSKRYRFLNLPILRGAVGLVETLYIGMKALTFSADIMVQEEEESKDTNPKKNDLFTTLWLALTLVLGVGLALFLFFYLPLVLADFTGIKQGFLFNLTSGLIRITIFLFYLWLITLWKSMRRIFEYHGAEHKSIFALESGEKLSLDNVRKYSTHHPRCGTSFLLIVMLVSIGVYIFLGRPQNVSERLIRLLYVPLIAGISYEIIKLSGKKRNKRLIRALLAPGLWLQRLTTKEPDDEQLKVAIVALENCLKE